MNNANPIEKVLQKLENCINNDTYEKFETHRYELKDNSHDSSGWKEIYKTANAFLNTKGGVIFVGIYEDITSQKYVFRGFDHRNEEKAKQISNQFSDKKGEKLNLDIYFPQYEFREFLTGHLLLIYVEELPEEGKYVYFNNKAYERLGTGDHVIAEKKINEHQEYKKHIIDSQELKPIINATIDDLDVDKLNQYIFLLNRIKKSEVQKPTIQDAMSFLIRKYMIRNEQPTLLGMLTCGRNPEDFLFNRCQIDCYVDVPSRELVARSKKILIDTIINLMENAENFVIQNIETGISIERGGSAVYEYPVELIRESINNSLAHRDYSIDRFVSIKVVPKKQIEIRNPGRFKPQLLIETDLSTSNPIRRIVPGDPLANNPKLVNILKVFDKWEGQGIGMATLTGACLLNEIALPYYIFHSQNELSLIIPSGRLLDKQMESFFETYSGYFNEKLNKADLSSDQKQVLTYFYKSEYANKLSRYTILLTKNNNHQEVIKSLLEVGLIFQHEKSDRINPVYLLDRILFKTNFNNELEKIYGDRFTQSKSEDKEVLNIIYETNNFSKDKNPSANRIGNILWLRKGNENVINGFEDYKRKIRYIVSKLEDSKFIVRVAASPQYAINVNFREERDLFNNNSILP